MVGITVGIPIGQPHALQVFYRLWDDWADVYVLDEHNVLWQQRLPMHDESSLLLPLQRFLQAVVFRQNARRPLAQGSLAIHYYQIMPSGGGRARRVEPRPAPQDSSGRFFYDVQAILQTSATESAHVTLYCNQKEFSALDHGDQLYAMVAREIVEQRREAAPYRCYITDLDLSDLLAESPGSSIRYLRYKDELEARLNDAMALL